MKDKCGNCKFFIEGTKYCNGSYLCSYHVMTTKPENMGCYLIQYNRIRNKEY